ncbi:MAG: hypothetical protein V4439_02420 [Patescibacteria group bacterium]
MLKLRKSNDLFGSHYFLKSTPTWVLILIYGLLYSMLWIGRWYFEGAGYDVAYSSRFGDMGLAIFILIATNIIKQWYFSPANWMESKAFHFGVALFGFIMSMIYTAATKPQEVMDLWHAIFIVQIFLYLIITILPVYWHYGNNLQKIIGLFLLLIWAGLVIYDGANERLDQRKWIEKNHPEWKFKKREHENNWSLPLGSIFFTILNI